MAVVVASAQPGTLKEEIPNVLHDPAHFSTMHWTATKRTNEKIISKMRGGQRLDWTADFLSTARANVAQNGRQQNIYGIRAPRPVGIITFEDVIDTILQKASRDEKDFFSNRTRSPLESLPPIHVPKARKTLKTPPGECTLRFRTLSKPREAAVNNLDGARDRKSSSSYTDNSDGGFHDTKNSAGSRCPRYDGKLTALDIADLTAMSVSLGNPYSQAKAASLPSRKTQQKEGISPRHVSASSALPANAPAVKGHSGLSASHGVETSGETIMTLSSWCEDYYEREQNFDSESPYDALPVTLQRMQDQNFSFTRGCPRDLGTITEERSNRSCENLGYDGFPPELLDAVNEDRVPKYASYTLPRMLGPENDSDFTTTRGKRFEDDRALLPSQRKPQPSMDIAAPRCSSLWF